MRDERKWWEYNGHEIAVAMAIGFVFGLALKFLCGCSSLPVSQPAYPEYDRWWTQGANTNSLEGLGQGDAYVRELVTTNLVLGADGLRREIVTNLTEAILL